MKNELTKKESIALLEGVARKYQWGLAYEGICQNICVMMGWYEEAEKYFMDIRRAQRFMASVGIKQPKVTSDTDFWWDPHDTAIRIKVLQSAIRRLKTKKNAKRIKNRKARS